MTRFDPPGFVSDLSEEQKEQWSKAVSGWLEDAKRGALAENDGPRPQFFNELVTPVSADAQSRVISWNAFPRQLKSSSLSDRHRWRRADADRNLQDEYCEWSVGRDPVTRKITRVTFTCEGPEYWQFVATVNPAKVLELYRQHISPSITTADLFANGNYDPDNRFNRDTVNGAMHLIQSANSLRAEIELGAAATIRRLLDGNELTDAQELILCSRYGEPGRNSDPHIGEQVNALARTKADISIKNPIGLYFHEFNPVGWETPDGADLEVIKKQFWKFTRGSEPYFVRAVFEVPAGRGYVVGDIRIAGRLIEFGAQITDFITIKLEGLATRIGQSTAKPIKGCRGEFPGDTPEMASAAVAGPLTSRRRAPSISIAPARTAGVAARRGVEAPAILREPTAHMDDVEDVAEVQDRLEYPKLPPEKFEPRFVSGRITAYSSPDSTYSVTRKLLDSATQSIVVGIYDFSADYILRPLKNAMQRGVRVSLMLDTNSESENRLFRELSDLGAYCVIAPSSSAGSPNAYFGNAHEKIIVVDQRTVMIQSGNWSENSIPFNEGDGVVQGQFQFGNRDMGMAVESNELATFFAELVARDMRLALGQPVDNEDVLSDVAPVAPVLAPSETFFEDAPAEVPSPLFSSLSVLPEFPVKITPVMTPENFHPFAKKLLRSAKRSIRIEQQYIRGGQPAVNELLQAMANARQENPGLEIRIIVSPKYLTGNNRRNFFQAMEDFHFPYDDNFRFLSPTHFVHCHNKLIVVDDSTVLLGSQNWSTTGLLTNRETSLLVEHAGLATYFAQIFDADWAMSEPDDTPLDALLPEGVGLPAPADFARGNVVISRTRDYLYV